LEGLDLQRTGSFKLGGIWQNTCISPAQKVILLGKKLIANLLSWPCPILPLKHQWSSQRSLCIRVQGDGWRGELSKQYCGDLGCSGPMAPWARNEAWIRGPRMHQDASRWTCNVMDVMDMATQNSFFRLRICWQIRSSFFHFVTLLFGDSTWLV
jgi:hypothetical protein